jgi:hypothetical protein
VSSPQLGQGGDAWPGGGPHPLEGRPDQASWGRKATGLATLNPVL